MKDCLTISLFCIGIYIAQSPGFVLERPRAFIQSILQRAFGRFSVYLEKPLFSCPLCMSSFWTIMFALNFGLFVPGGIIIGIPVVCALNALFLTITKEVIQ